MDKKYERKKKELAGKYRSKMEEAHEKKMRGKKFGIHEEKVPKNSNASGSHFIGFK